MKIPQTIYSQIIFVLISIIFFGIANILWINTDIFIGRLAVYLMGLHLVFAYLYNTTMHGPAFTIQPNKMTPLRFTAFLMGIALMIIGVTNK